MEKTQQYRRPAAGQELCIGQNGHIRIVLTSDSYTPVMVYSKRKSRASATFGCADGSGELMGNDGDEYLSDADFFLIEDVRQEAEAWEDHQKGGRRDNADFGGPCNPQECPYCLQSV